MAGLWLSLAAVMGLADAPAPPSAPLADAAQARDWAGVAALLAGDAALDAAQPDGMTALHWAVDHDHVPTAGLLLERGAASDTANRYGVRPLSLACRNGNAAMVGLLLDQAADQDAPLASGETPLMTAARTGRVDAVRRLLDAGATIDATERRGQTALMWAAAEGHADVLALLIERGADPRRSLASGFSAFFFAIREGRLAVVPVLRQAGIDVNEPMRPKRQDDASLTPLDLAIENGHFELAAALLAAGADPASQRTGFTPLHRLTWVRKPNRGDDASGNPPPIGSGRLTSLELVDALVAHGADVNARLERGESGRGVLGRRGATPFLLASMTADLPLMRRLVALGADPCLPNAQGSSPLMAAAGLGCLAPGEVAGTEDEAIEAVKYCVELGNELNAVDENGETAMHGAAYKSLPAVVVLLDRLGASVEIWNRENRYGWTPIRIAEGYRPGNFKPAPETLAALRAVIEARKAAASITAPERPGGSLLQDRPRCR